jgi:uncharacterized RDD family membrane protein YckC
MSTVEAADLHPLEYVGFWARVIASLLDTIVILLIAIPLTLLVYGRDLATAMEGNTAADILISYVLPLFFVIGFWVARQATPGKMAFAARIVDACSGGKPSGVQWAIRYVGYFVSTIPFLLGLIWVAFDPRKQGWHDKLAGTVVVRPLRGGGPLASFDR